MWFRSIPEVAKWHLTGFILIDLVYGTYDLQFLYICYLRLQFGHTKCCIYQEIKKCLLVRHSKGVRAAEGIRTLRPSPISDNPNAALQPKTFLSYPQFVAVN